MQVDFCSNNERVSVAEKGVSRDDDQAMSGHGAAAFAHQDALSAVAWPVVRRWIEKLSDRVEDLLALIFWDGASWKEPRKDRRNGL